MTRLVGSPGLPNGAGVNGPGVQSTGATSKP
jgi:hypothetical protein